MLRRTSQCRHCSPDLSGLTGNIEHGVPVLSRDGVQAVRRIAVGLDQPSPGRNGSGSPTGQAGDLMAAAHSFGGDFMS
jgi:hypothetical protein